MRWNIFTAAALAAATGACASYSEKIPATYVSPVIYENLSYRQIAEDAVGRGVHKEPPLETRLHDVRRWTVEQIAREAGTSRSALAERFTELLGEAPMHYLAAWRIHLARQLLCEPARSIPDIAVRVGYESEAAFARAFKRLVGTPPAAWGRAAKDPRPKAS
jgi:AraC-like DNA-binding protein